MKGRNWLPAFLAAALALAVLAAVALIALVIYCYAAYGSLPASEVPAWVWWIMRR